VKRDEPLDDLDILTRRLQTKVSPGVLLSSGKDDPYIYPTRRGSDRRLHVQLRDFVVGRILNAAGAFSYIAGGPPAVGSSDPRAPCLSERSRLELDN
jgi:hypothetical protein